MLNYGEHYLAFGWIGIIIGGLATGMFSRIGWNWFLRRKEEQLAIVFIAVFNSFLYVVLSRGYLPQVVMNFFFTLGPIIYLINRSSKAAQKSLETKY
jgi:hypothetical protein